MYKKTFHCLEEHESGAGYHLIGPPEIGDVEAFAEELEPGIKRLLWIFETEPRSRTIGDAQ